MSFIDRAIIGARFMLDGASLMKLFVHSTWNFLRFAQFFSISRESIPQFTLEDRSSKLRYGRSRTICRCTANICMSILMLANHKNARITYLFATHRDKLSVGKSC